MFNSNVYLSCEDKPTDLPKKATLPSVQTDTMSIAEEDFNMAARLVYFIAFESRLYTNLHFQGIHHKLHQGESEQQLQIRHSDQYRLSASVPWIPRVRQDSECVQESDEQPQEVRGGGSGVRRQLGEGDQQTLQKVRSS